MIASKAYWTHNFPAPHIDAVESVIEPGGESADPDERVLSDDDLERAKEEGEQGQS